MNITLLEKIHELHEKNIDGITEIAILKNWGATVEEIYAGTEKGMYDKMFVREAFLEEISKEIEEENEDVFFSINAFYKTKETKSVWHLNAFVIDFDFYKIKKFKALSPKQMYEQYIADILPLKPTAVVDSGNGLYVIYAFKNASKHCVALYRAIYKAIYKQYKQYGMDRAAMNITQVIRVPGTLNPKCNKIVEILEFNDTNYVLNDFYSMLDYSYDEVQVYKEEVKVNRVKNLPELTKERIEKSIQNKRNECKRVIADFKKLIQLRNRSGYYEGYREMMVYILRERMRFAKYTIEEEENTALELNDLFVYPLKKKEVLNTANPYNRYKVHKIESIIDKLNINEEEQSHLSYLQCKNMKDRVRVIRKRKNFFKSNRTRKQQLLFERRKSVIECVRKGMRNKEIAKVLNLRKDIVSKDVKYCLTYRYLFVYELNAYMQQLRQRKTERKQLRDSLVDMPTKWLNLLN